MFLRVVLKDVVFFLSPRNVLKMVAMLRGLSSFLITRIFPGCCFEFVVEVLSCFVAGRRVRIGRVEGLFVVCWVGLYRVLVPVEFVVTASALIFAVFLAGLSIR